MVLMLIFMVIMQILPFVIIYALIKISYILYQQVKVYNLLESIEQKEDLIFLGFRDFINVVAEAFRRKGYKVEFTVKCGEEGNGLILNDKLYVEVWKNGYNYPIEVETAMKLSNHMQSNSVYRGMIISSADFKLNTRTYCHKNVIECVNSLQILAILKDAQRRHKLYQTN